MKIIFKIARTELRNLFYSPVAWFLAIVFLVLCAIHFTDSLMGYALKGELMVKNDPRFGDFGYSLTRAIFSDSPVSIFPTIFQNLYLFIPLLTMGVMSREINNGTIKLLYSSPVRLREIVLGKYLALMIYNLLLICIIGIFILTGIFTISSVDYGMLLSALLGFYLLICAYAAIGIFMSSLSTYQVVSAIATFSILFILGSIALYWQQYDFIRDLAWFLEISGRAGKMAAGLITTKDVLYFLVIIYMFLGFTLLKLKGGRESKPLITKALRYAAVVVSSLFVGYVSSRPGMVGYWDTTAGQVNTIHPRIQKILKELGNDPLQVTLYTNLLGGNAGLGFPEGRNYYLDRLWEPYLRFKPDIQFKYVYYYDNDGTSDSTLYKMFPHKTEKQLAGLAARANQVDSAKFMPPDNIRKLINLGDEKVQLVMQLKYKGRTEFLRTFPDPPYWPNQPQVAAALKRLLRARIPKVYFLTGNLERNVYKIGERDYSMFSTLKLNRNALVNMGFDTDTLSLDTRELPADMDILVISDPKVVLGAATLNKVRQYIDKGGNLLVFGEPGKQYVLNPLLKQLGVQLMNGQLVELSRNETPEKVYAYMTEAGLNLGENSELLAVKEHIKRKIEGDSAYFVTPGVTALAYAANGPFTITPLFTTIAQHKTWLKAGHLVIDSVPPVFSPKEGDIKAHSFPTAIQLTRQLNHQQQRIIVCGDADFASNLRGQGPVTAFFSWLNYGKYPIYTPYPFPKDTLVTISSSTANVIGVIYVWVLPGLLLLAGIILLIRRKRK